MVFAPDIFATNSMTLTHADGTVVATGLLCQLDTFNFPFNMEVQGLVVTDYYDLYSVGWDKPVPLRSDYFVDETTGMKYSMFSEVFVNLGTVQCRVSKLAGSTP